MIHTYHLAIYTFIVILAEFPNSKPILINVDYRCLKQLTSILHLYRLDQVRNGNHRPSVRPLQTSFQKVASSTPNDTIGWMGA